MPRPDQLRCRAGTVSFLLLLPPTKLVKTVPLASPVLIPQSSQGENKVPSPTPSVQMTLRWTDQTNGRGDLLLPIERLLVPRSHSKGVIPEEFDSN